MNRVQLERVQQRLEERLSQVQEELSKRESFHEHQVEKRRAVAAAETLSEWRRSEGRALVEKAFSTAPALRALEGLLEAVPTAHKNLVVLKAKSPLLKEAAAASSSRPSASATSGRSST